MEEARQHLQRRGLPRSVRSEETDDLSSVDPERDAGDRVHVLTVAPDERSERRGEALLALRDLKSLAQFAYVYNGIGHSGMMTACFDPRECIICCEQKEADHG